MRIAKQLSVFLKNKPGTLSGICELLHESGINILGFSVSDSVDHAVVRMVVSDPLRALHLLGDSGILVLDNDVLCVPLDNEPGQLANLSNKLAANCINIEYAYGGIDEAAKTGVLFLRVSDTKAALQAICS
jgi:hypothetical protein